MRKITLTIICILLLVVSLIIVNVIQAEQQKEMVQVSDNVRVSEKIIQGFEGEDYIPRSVSINKKLRGIE